MPDPCVNAARHPVELDSGRMLAPGEPGEVDLSSAHNQQLVDDGQLVQTAPKPKRAKPDQKES